jgi:hypothetical protein
VKREAHFVSGPGRFTLHERRFTNFFRVADVRMNTANWEPVQDPSFICRYIKNPYTTTRKTEEAEHDAQDR